MPVATLLVLTACEDSQQRSADAAAIAAETVKITEIRSMAGIGSAEPNLALTADGHPVLSWLQPADRGVELRYSVLTDNHWSTPTVIAAGDDWFVNWADFPSVVPIDERTWAAHWLRKSGSATYAYDVVLSLSNDAGQSWTEGRVLHDDGTASEHGFVSLFPWQGHVGAAWLDGRKTLSDSPDAAMTLRSAVVDRDGRVQQSTEVDKRICDCCQTDVALGGTGPLLVYRDRSDNEIRDISLARYVDGAWSEAIRVAADHWEIRGCPVNGPAVDVSQDVVAVTWFTGANEQPMVKVAFSTDDGASFADAITLDGDQPVGRVDLVMLPDNSAIVSWLTESGNEGAKIVAQRVRPSGQAGPRVLVARTRAARMSGFPRQVLHGRELIVAYTDTEADDAIVRTLRVPLAAFEI